MPIPRSLTDSSTRSPSRLTPTLIAFCSGLYLIALLSRLMSACDKASASSESAGSSSATSSSSAKPCFSIAKR